MASQKDGLASEVMISNLPLLFARGQPTCLEKLTLSELQNFIPFLLQCSVGHTIEKWKSIQRPQWWPLTLPFSEVILSLQEPIEHWREVFRSLVFNCYEYHDSEYLLHFCDQLVEQCEACQYSFRDNNDGTTSLIDGSSGKLFVTFRNENREYDRHLYEKYNGSPRRTLLPRSPSRSFTSQHPTVISSLKLDIYLCDTCDAEFASLEEIKQHEKECIPPPPSPILWDTPSVELGADHQDSFLAYFKLQPIDMETDDVIYCPSPRGLKHHLGTSYNRYCSIAVASPLGQSIMKRSRLGVVANPLSSIARYERCCVAPPKARQLFTQGGSRHQQTQKYPVTYRKNRNVTWYHKYSFNWKQRAEQMRTIETGLDRRSRILMRKCRRFTIPLRKLTESDIQSWTRKPQVLLEKQTLETKTKLIKKETEQTGPILVINLCSSDEEEIVEVPTQQTKNEMGHWPQDTPPLREKGIGEAVNGQPPHTATTSPSKFGIIASWLSKLAKINWSYKPAEEVYTTQNKSVRRKKKKCEMTNLLNDECKELRLKGLQSLLTHGETVLRPRNPH